MSELRPGSVAGEQGRNETDDRTYSGDGLRIWW